jgi:uncharacterized protein (TIGR03118 family)
VHTTRRAAVAAAVLAAVLAATIVARSSARSDAYVETALVSDHGGHAAHHDVQLVNAWGLAASPTGPWWTANEARGSSTLYSASGRKQLLTVHVDGGPTGVAYNGGDGFVIHGGGRSDPARFIYACEDGVIRAWTPTVPTGWSTKAVVAYDDGSAGAIFRGVALAGSRLYATDFHNGRVVLLDSHWHQVRLARGAFTDAAISPWDAPFGIAVLGGHVFVTYAFRAPVDGNDSPTGGYVDEFTLAGRLVARLPRQGLNEPWGLALAPQGFGRFSGDLLVGNFGDGTIKAFRRTASGWALAGTLADADHKPLVINGLWALAFGNDGLAGNAKTLYFTAGPHAWHGPTEVSVHGLLGSIKPA